ncbi:MAG: FHA domain-containing protein [Deltaproteobacteria bacterium]
MRECLGWITTCPNDQSCPMNWLELAVSEIPIKINCHVCERKVSLVATQAELDSAGSSNALAAFPVVPCAGPTDAPMAPATGNGAAGHAEPVRARPPTPAPAPVARAWTVTLQNGEMIKIDKDTMIIGRSRTCDVVIPSAKVSRQHASLSRMEGELYIEDLGSANGVWLNGEKVTRAKIKAGDSFTISDETLLFEER